MGAHRQLSFLAVFLLALSEAVPNCGAAASTLILAISALATTAGITPWALLVAAVLGAKAGDRSCDRNCGAASTLILAISALATTAGITPWALLVAAVLGAKAGDAFCVYFEEEPGRRSAAQVDHIRSSGLSWALDLLSFLLYLACQVMSNAGQRFEVLPQQGGP